MHVVFSYTYALLFLFDLCILDLITCLKGFCSFADHQAWSKDRSSVASYLSSPYFSNVSCLTGSFHAQMCSSLGLKPSFFILKLQKKNIYFRLPFSYFLLCFITSRSKFPSLSFYLLLYKSKKFSKFVYQKLRSSLV